MADVTKRAKPSIDAQSAMVAEQAAPGWKAGETLTRAAPAHVEADGLVYNSVDGDPFDGFTPQDYLVGEPVTLYGAGCIFGYGPGLVPGDRLYLSATPGRLSDTPVSAGAVPVAKVLVGDKIQVTRSV
jgi:hypothetical protein